MFEGKLKQLTLILIFNEIMEFTMKLIQVILDEYEKNGHSFLFKVFETSKYLEDLSGISALMKEEHAEVGYGF